MAAPARHKQPSGVSRRAQGGRSCRMGRPTASVLPRTPKKLKVRPSDAAARRAAFAEVEGPRWRLRRVGFEWWGYLRK